MTDRTHSKGSMTIILVRHGAVEGLDPPRFRGRMDLPLTEQGRRQAEATAARIAAEWQVDAVVTSPLARCVDTGTAIAAATSVPATVEPGFIDFDYGEWAWKTHPEVQAGWPDLYERWFTMPQLVRIPGGNSLQDLLGQSADGLRAVREAQDRKTVVIVGHDSVNRSLLLQLLDLPLSAYWRLRQDPCCINEIEFGERVIVHRINETWHLRGVADDDPA